MTRKPKKIDTEEPVRRDRRSALAALGLAAGAAYAAPLVLPLDRSANAQVLPSPCRPGKGKGKGGC